MLRVTVLLIQKKKTNSFDGEEEEQITVLSQQVYPDVAM